MRYLTKQACIFLMVASILVAGCKSTTVIRSYPQGAKVYIDGVYQGNTPVQYSDRKTSLSKTKLLIKKEGYQTKNITLKKDELQPLNLITGFFIIVPLAWSLGYEKNYSYELEPTRR